MAAFSQEFKVQSVEKALSKSPEQTLKEISGHGVFLHKGTKRDI